MISFSVQQRRVQAAYKQKSDTFSDAGRKDGTHRGRSYPFLLEAALWQENLYPGVRDFAPGYFDERSIVWHQMRHHLLSSQVCCINFLMPYARKKEALSQLFSRVFKEEVEALPIQGDEEAIADHTRENYLGFEWIGGDHLGETSKGGRRTRGANCTSADAVVRLRRQGRVEVWLIEWKYTESYGNPLPEAGSRTRSRRYSNLAFSPSGPIRSDLGLVLEDFFYEPFYQLLRQQMLAWQMQRVCEQGAERVGVLHLAPRSNIALQKLTAPALRKFGTTISEVWPKLLVDSAHFESRAVEDLFGPEGEAADPAHRAYLLERYTFLQPVATAT